jgi:hypothetical protein
MKKGSGVYNLATAYNAGGAINMTVSIAKNRRIDFLDFKLTPGNGKNFLDSNNALLNV